MPNDIKKLLDSHKNMIEMEASKQSSFIPHTVALAEAYHIAKDAARTYDPKSGVKFSTYLTSHLQKLSRISTQYGGAIRLPEHQQFKVQKLNDASAHLNEELGRDPSVAELSDHTGMGLAQVNLLLHNRKKDVNFNNLSDTPIFASDTASDDWTHFVYHDLPPNDKIIFEHKTGFGNKEVLDNSQIAKKLNISVSSVGHRVNLITRKLQENPDGF